MRGKCKHRAIRGRTTADSLVATCENEKVYKYNLVGPLVIESPLVCEDCELFEEDTE